MVELISSNQISNNTSSTKEKVSSLQSRLKETDETIQRMKTEMNNIKSDYQKDLDQKNLLIKENQEKVCC